MLRPELHHQGMLIYPPKCPSPRQSEPYIVQVFAIALLALSLYAFLFLISMLWAVLLVPAGVNIDRRPRRADARVWSSSRGDDGDEPEWDSVVNQDR